MEYKVVKSELKTFKPFKWTIQVYKDGIHIATYLYLTKRDALSDAKWYSTH